MSTTSIVDDVLDVTTIAVLSNCDDAARLLDLLEALEQEHGVSKLQFPDVEIA
jgi:hypothetical protein